MALAALDALDAGHSAAAQALAGALLDSMVNSYLGTDSYGYAPDKHGKRTNAAYDEFTAHEYIALAPIWQAWQKYFPDEGLPIPHTFSRNATAHTVSAKQYTKRNAVQSLMIASSLMYFFDREARRLESFGVTARRQRAEASWACRPRNDRLAAHIGVLPSRRREAVT